MLINYLLITACTRIAVFAPQELAVQVMKVSGSEQNPEGTVGAWGEGKGQRARRLQPGEHVAPPSSLWYWQSESFNNVQKKGEEGVEIGFTCRGWGAKRVCFVWWWKCREPGVRSKAEIAVQRAGSSPAWNLPAECKCGFTPLPPSFCIPWQGCFGCPQKTTQQHLPPLGTGTDSPEGNPWTRIPVVWKCSSC